MQQKARTLMTHPKILVTGATGKTGSAVVAQLRERNWPVRAIVRVRDARSERLERLGAEIVVADLFDPEQLQAAMKGTVRAYYCPPFHPYMVQSAAAFAVAARGAKLEAIVGLSQWLASPAHPSLATRQDWLVDQLFALLPDTAHVIVNPGYFADNYLRLLDFAALLGIFPVLTGDSRNAPPSNEDIARVVVAALMEPERHAGKRYRPTGPTLLSAFEMANIIQSVLGSRVYPVDMPLWLFLRAARLQGVSAFELSGLRHYVEEHKRGTFELGAPTDDVYEVTGHPPETFEATVRHYAERPEFKQTFANRLRALTMFMRVPFSPGYDLKRFESEQFHPVPPAPRLAIDDTRWQAEHSATTPVRVSELEPAVLFRPAPTSINF